ncbi:MAG TPA: hypothetical protein VGJ54_14860 [Streptosporangiaceae bacterium]
METKSTEVRSSWPLSCTVHCRPPSVVARILSCPTTQPSAAETNCTPVRKPAGNRGTAAPRQPRPAAAGLPDG